MDLDYTHLLMAVAEFVDKYNDKERKDIEMASVMLNKALGTVYVVYRNICDDDDIFEVHQATLVNDQLLLTKLDALPDGVKDLGAAYRQMYYQEFDEVCKQDNIPRWWKYNHRQACLNGLLAAMPVETRTHMLAKTTREIDDEKKSSEWAQTKAELHRIIREQLHYLRHQQIH